MTTSQRCKDHDVAEKLVPDEFQRFLIAIAGGKFCYKGQLRREKGNIEFALVRIVSKAHLAIGNMILSFFIFIHILHLSGYQQNFFSLEIIFTWIFFIFSLPLADMYLFSDKNVAVQFL